MNAGDSYDLTIVNGNVYTADDLGVWIDWNQDDDFDDAGENVVCDIDNSGQGTFSIANPNNATAGTTTMRIRMKWSGSDCGSPCGTTTYGEVEDYSINIVGWLLVSPTSGTILPGMSQQLDVTFDATGLAEGIYPADIIVYSNDPGQPSVVVPATLNVSLGDPEIVVLPSSLDFGDVQVGLNNALQFSIENTGTGVLAGTITTPTGYTVSNAKGDEDNVLSFAVNEGITEYYDVVFAPTAAQPYNGDITIDHNAGVNPNLFR
ncbi:MAG: GEVED domain-containing protein [Bacteroidales bacterium]